MSSPTEDAAAEYNAEGLQHNREGDAHTALECFLKAHELAPTKCIYLLSAANMQLKLGEFTLAAVTYRSLLEGEVGMQPKHRLMAEQKLRLALDRTLPTDVAEKAPPALVELIGRGSYGSVWRARYAGSGAEVAVKIVPHHEKAPEGDIARELRREIALMRGFKNEHIVGFIDAFPAPGQPEVWVLMELCEHGSLKEVLRRLGPLDEMTVAAVCHGMLQGLR